MSEMDAKVGHLPGPYQLDVAYVQPIGTVKRFVMDEPYPDRLDPYIQRALREPFSVELSEEYSETRPTGARPWKN